MPTGNSGSTTLAALIAVVPLWLQPGAAASAAAAGLRDARAGGLVQRGDAGLYREVSSSRIYRPLRPHSLPPEYRPSLIDRPFRREPSEICRTRIRTVQTPSGPVRRPVRVCTRRGVDLFE